MSWTRHVPPIHLLKFSPQYLTGRLYWGTGLHRGDEGTMRLYVGGGGSRPNETSVLTRRGGGDADTHGGWASAPPREGPRGEAAPPTPGSQPAASRPGRGKVMFKLPCRWWLITAANRVPCSHGGCGGGGGAALPARTAGGERSGSPSQTCPSLPSVSAPQGPSVLTGRPKWGWRRGQRFPLSPREG